jgi:hypothetical protein
MGVKAARTNRPWPAILIGGLLAGIGDIAQAFVVFGHYNAAATPFRILQGIARGLFGARTFQMGWNSALAGLFVHFFIATTAAAVYYLASRYQEVLIRHWVICGLLFGEMVFLFMYFVVMPLSILGWPKFNIATYLTGPIGHPLLVGLPIAWSIHRFGQVYHHTPDASK